MKEHLDKLSKDLASGMTRRQALRLFFTGLGAAAVVGLSGRSASAQSKKVCVDLCRAQGLTGSNLDACVAASAECPRGECAVCVNGHNCICVPVDNGHGNDVCVDLCREQGLTGSEFGACVSTSAQCPPGECAICVNGNCVCVPVDNGNNVCVELCLEQGLEGSDLEECIVASALCPPGKCAMVINGRNVCIAVGNF
jgi:hypothetical protein